MKEPCRTKGDKPQISPFYKKNVILPAISLNRFIMELPKDPAMLLSFVNTKLRDEYPSLREMCLSMDIDSNALTSALQAIGYEYDERLNKFI